MMLWLTFRFLPFFLGSVCGVGGVSSCCMGSSPPPPADPPSAPDSSADDSPANLQMKIVVNKQEILGGDDIDYKWT